MGFELFLVGTFFGIMASALALIANRFIIIGFLPPKNFVGPPRWHPFVVLRIFPKEFLDVLSDLYEFHIGFIFRLRLLFNLKNNTFFWVFCLKDILKVWNDPTSSSITIVSMSLFSSIVVTLVLNLSGSDLRIFLTISAGSIGFPNLTFPFTISYNLV